MSRAHIGTTGGLEALRTAALASELAPAPALMADPRRTVVLVQTHSSSPRSKRWYRIVEVCEFDGQFFMHRDYVNSREERRGLPGYLGPTTRGEAISLGKQLADEFGRPFLPGLYRNGVRELIVRLD